MSFLGEIKRRKVFQVAAVYAVVAWLLVQIVVSVEAPLNLPDWADTFVIVLVLIGFPLAIVLSWAYDLTPRGIVRTPPSVEQPATPQVGPPAQAPDLEALPNSVAVLPFENLSPNVEDAFFAAGIHEELLNQLAKIQDLRVIARTSVMQYEGARRSVSAIAAELRVGTLMEGSVRYAGNRVRVTAQLIDGPTEGHLWSDVYERDLADVFAIQADIATQIASALKAKFSGAEQLSVEKQITRSPEAYGLYLQAMAIARESGIDEVVHSPQLRAALQSRLDEAIAIDPDFALAYVYRARVQLSALRFDIGGSQTDASPVAELENRALADLNKALALDPDLGVAHATLARIHQGHWRRAEAEAAYERALELRPNDPEILNDAALFKATIGKREEAVRLGRKALALDPSSGLAHYFLAVTYMQLGEIEAAIDLNRQVVGHIPTQAIQRANYAVLEYVLGNKAIALEQTTSAEQLLGENVNPASIAGVAYAYGRVGAHDDALRLFKRLQETAATRRIAAGAWAFGYLAIGDDAQALHWLEVAAEKRDPYEAYYSVLMLRANAFADPVLERPEFVEVRHRLGFED